MKIGDLEALYPHLYFECYPSNKAFLYFICNPNLEIIYIGLTSMIYQRISVHYTRPEFFNMPVFFIETNLKQGRELEEKFVKDFKPLYNLAKPHKGKLKEPREKKYIVDCDKVKRIMKKRGITQVNIAEKCETTRQNVSGLINSGYIPQSIFEAIANELDLTVPAFKVLCK